MIMELELVYNEETKEWEQKPEPFITIECETEEDFEFIGNAIAFYKKHLAEQEKPQTNADRIRAMSDEELANFVASKIVNIENQKMLEQGHISTATQLRALGATMHDILIMWLKQPAEEEKTVTECHR
jgi:hypothetical protein